MSAYAPLSVPLAAMGSGSNSTLSPSSASSDSSLLVSSVELSVVWLLLAGFVLACLLLSAVGGIKWRRHKRWEELTYSQKANHADDEDVAAAAAAAASGTGEDGGKARGSIISGGHSGYQSSASEQLSSFSRQLHSQHASTVSLLADQQSLVRSQLDRLCAEAEQLKALLAARLSGDRGFVDAAIALLLSDITAAESYRRRQVKREDEALRAHNDCIERLDEAGRALAGQLTSGGSSIGSGNISSQSSMSRAKEAAESLIRSVSSVQREADKERARVRHSSASSSSILGNEAVALLNRNADDEAEAERSIARLLHTARTAADNFLFACLEHDMEANGAPAAHGGSSTVYIHRLQLTCRRFHSEVTRSVTAWPAAATALGSCRSARSLDETEALQCLEKQKQIADGEAHTGLFAGLDQQLVDSITALIRQTAAAQQQQQQQQRAQQHQSQWRTAVGASSASSGTTGTSSLIAALLQSTSKAADAESTSAAASASPFSSDSASSSSTPPSSLSSASLGASFSAWRENSALLSGLMSADASRSVALCGELDRLAVHSALSAADELTLRDATAGITQLHATHSAALARLGERSRTDEQRAVEQRLAAIQERERDADRQREALQADFDASMAASRATVAAEADTDEGESGAALRLQAEFESAMESLQSALQQDTLAAQTELHAIHQQHHSKLTAQQSELRRQQHQQMLEAVRQYELTHSAATLAADEKSALDLQLEGVDVPNMRLATLQALNTPSAREAALAALHHSNIDEINRRQQSDKRTMEEDMEQRHRDAMQAARAEWEEDTGRQRALADDELEQRLRSATDAITASAMRSQHADANKKREKRLQEEWSAQEASRQQQHNATLDSRRQQLAVDHAAERAVELSDQKDEMFQVRLAACKQQETALLDQALHAGTRSDGRRLIESAMFSRHAAERSRLVAQQELNNSSDHIARLLDADRAALSERRQQVERDVIEGRLSEAEAAAAVSSVDADSSAASTSQRVFAAMAESAAASLNQLHARQWEEVRTAMMRAFPDESFSGSGWQQQQQHGALNDGMRAMADQQAQALQSALDATRDHLASIEREEQAAVERCRAEQQERMEQLETRLTREEAAIRAQFDAQLQEAQSEHEAKLALLSDDLQRISEQQPVDERAVAEYRAAIEDEQLSHAALMQQAAQQFEAEVAMRSEAQRVHQRAANHTALTDAIKQARTDRQQQEKEALAQQNEMAEQAKDDAKRAMRVLERLGRKHRQKTNRGVKLALQAIVANYTATKSVVPAPQHQQQTSAQSGIAAPQHEQTTAPADGLHHGLPLPLPSTSASQAQLDRIEALIRQQMASGAMPTHPQSSTSLTSASSSLHAGPSMQLSSAISTSLLSARQQLLLASLQRTQVAICTALAISELELRVTTASSVDNSGSINTDSRLMDCAPLPFANIYTLFRADRVLLIHDHADIPLSHHNVAMVFLSTARQSHFNEATHTPKFLTTLVVAVVAAMESSVQQQQSHAVDQSSSGSVSLDDSQAQIGTVLAGEKDAEALVDHLTEQLCVLLAEAGSNSSHNSHSDSSKLRAVLEAIDGASVAYLESAVPRDF